jgi:methyltransferase (TIGR00027 family)
MRAQHMVNRREMLGSIAAAGTAALWPAQPFALGAGEPSRTAQGAALHRAAHQLLEQPLVFHDPLALKILGPERQSLLEANLPRRQSLGSRAMRAFIVMRSRHAEDELAAAFTGGTRQYVVLGAGLDTFAYRNPHGEQLRVFEVDHPATQDWKRKQLDAQGIDVPHGLRFVAVDFEKDALGDCLDRAGFDRKAPAFISWLGVSIYLTKEAVAETLRFVGRSCAGGSQIVFDFAVPDDLLSETERSRREKRARTVSAAGEPWISHFDPGTLAADLLGMGFNQAASFGADDANERYFTGRTDGFRVVGSGRIMQAGI